MSDDIEVICPAKVDSVVTIKPNAAGFSIYDLSDTKLAKAMSPRALADWAFKCGAKAVRFDFDLGDPHGLH